MTAKQTRLKTLQFQITRLEKKVTYLNAISNRFAWIRLSIFTIGTIASGIALFSDTSSLSLPLFALTLLAYFIFAGRHGRIKTLSRTLQAWITLKQVHIARMQLNWKSIPRIRGVVPEPGHPFEVDLDITGDYSLHRLLNTAMTQDGTLRLRDWLLTTSPELATIRQRQALVCELKSMESFRDRLILKAVQAGKGVADYQEGKAILNWLAKNPARRSFLHLVVVLIVLALLNILLSTRLLPLPSPVLALTFSLYALLTILNLQSLETTFEEAYSLKDGLTKLEAVLGFLETYDYGKHQHLRDLCAPLLDPSRRPSASLRRLNIIVAATSLKYNGIMWLIINTILPWGITFAYLFDRVKTELAERLPGWLEIWFDLEALSSLANFADLNPDMIIPEFMPLAVTDSATHPVFEGRNIGHPLLPDEQRICNDFTIDHLGKVSLITGSNMAGKSSFLRTLGMNLCLAYVGAPVLADQLRIPLFRLFTCIKVSDSVTDGVSYFYAEVKRLKALLEALELEHSLPLFFLIDEIFRGTNNRERLIGSRAYIRALVGRNGIGVISTHDLELVKLADEVSQITNYHFAETIAEGQMHFDYKLRPGPSPTTNALKIMQLEGLPIDISEIS